MPDNLIQFLKIGDTVTINTSKTTYTGKIKSLSESLVLLMNNDSNMIAGVKPEAIESFEVHTDSLNKPNQVHEESKEHTPPDDSKDIKDNPHKTIDILSNTSLPGLKIIGKISEEKLIDSKTKKATKIKTKPKMVLRDLSELRKIVLPEIEEENKKIVPANGIIESYYRDKNYGFIRYKSFYNVYFSFNDIIDDDLILGLRGKVNYTNIPVLFTLSKSKKGDKAINIHKPKSVDNIIDRINKYIRNNSIDKANALIDQILISFPDNQTAHRMKDELGRKISKEHDTSFNNHSYPTDYLNYQKATRAKNVDKNYEEALRFYLLALKNNEKKESCIKDIAMLYVAMGNSDKAYEFIKVHEDELPRTITTYNYLVNLYSSIKIFDKVIEYIELLLDNRYIAKDKRKQSFYLSQKGFSLIQLNKYEDAKTVLNEAVLIYHENTYADRLLKALAEPESNELVQIIAEAEFESFGGGISKLLKETIENYSDYYGIPAKVIDKSDFNQATLNNLRNLIDTAGKARPRERANFLLTEAKLMILLEPEKDISYRAVLARYCNAMALNHITENSSLDVVRNYYLEAFKLEEKYQYLAPQVALYLMSYKCSYSDLLGSKTPSIDDALSYVLDGEVRENIWEGILSMFLWNRSISSQIIAKLFQNSDYRKKSIIYLKMFIDTIPFHLSINDYTGIWNIAREKRIRDYSSWLAAIKALHGYDTLESTTSQLLVTINDSRKGWLLQTDVIRLNTISTDIYDNLNQYLKQSGYRNKERFYGIIKAQVNQLVVDIKEKPTMLSYEGIIPLLEKIILLLDKSFATIEAASAPSVTITISVESSAVGADNEVPFQIMVHNSKESSPIRDVRIIIEDNNDVIFLSKDNINRDSIDGGEFCIVQLFVKVSEKVKTDKATTLNAICEYKTRNKDEVVRIHEQLSLRLFSEEEFIYIDNPYSPLADGGPVENPEMFYGRDEFIDSRINAILNSDSKQIIIYGQKRSGKSSVLYHLKKGLESTNQTFCVLFSLGLIVKELNEYTFYHKILSSIERELNLRRARKEIVPTFKCPSMESFTNKYASNPANGFVEQLEDYKIACMEVPGWMEKKLVVMIDEFTYLYTAIRRGTTSNTIMKQWKAITQSENVKFSVVLVGQDVVPSFKKEDYAKNAFGVIEDIRLTYLDEKDARALIDEPISLRNQLLDKIDSSNMGIDINNKSRFIPPAIETIIDYTSRNPYYIQIFCARLVDYMNSKKLMRVTSADIKNVAETFIEGNQALAPEKFDNLIRAGEEHDIKEFDDEPIIKILRQIAIGSKNIGICSRENISINDHDLEDKILNHLIDREVLEKRQGDNYKIQVRLFQEWLLRH